jgi:hypothetical protein
MSKFTKGESWYKAKTSNRQGLIIDERTGRSVAVSYEEEDAHLISACPEMYEACKRAFNWLHVIISDFEIKNPENKDALMGLQNFIYKALSKAEGKE